MYELSRLKEDSRKKFSGVFYPIQAAFVKAEEPFKKLEANGKI